MVAGASMKPVVRQKRYRRYWIAAIGTGLLLAFGAGIALFLHSIEAPPASAQVTAAGSAAPQPPGLDTAAPSAEEIPREAAENVVLSVDRRSSDRSPDDAPAAVEGTDPVPVGQGTVPSPARTEAIPFAAPAPVAMENATRAAKQREASGPLASVASVSKDTRQDFVENPALVERYYRKALSYHRQGRLQRAIVLYREVLQLQPNHADARFNLVSAYIDTHEYDNAHRIAAELYRQDNRNPQILTNLAIAKIGLAQFREALALLDQASDLPQASTFTIWLHKGIACRGLNQLEAAIGWYQKAEELNPEHSQLLFNLALAHDSQQQYGKALHYYQAYLAQASDAEDQTQKGIRQRITTLRAYLAAEPSQEGREP
jgi:thioredoxin-like negative regulator of GroEL